MTEPLPSAVLRAVHRLTGIDGAPEEEDLELLSQWLDAVLARSEGQRIDELLLATQPGTTERRQLRYLVQARAARQVVGQVADTRVVQVFGIPLFLEHSGGSVGPAQPLPPLSVAQEVARTLEYALELPAQSIELSQHLTDVDEAYAWTALEWRELAREVRSGADTLRAGPARLAARPRTGVVWLGVVSVPPADEDSVYRAFGRAHLQRPAMAAYRHRSAELLERDFQLERQTITANLYMPVLLPQLFAAFRSLELNMLITDAVRPHRAEAKTLGFGQDTRNLRIRVEGADEAPLVERRFQLAELGAEDVERVVLGTARRLGLATRAL